MGKSTVWTFELDGRPVTVTCELKGNKYILYLDDDHLTNVYRLNAKKMRYGMEEEILIGSERCRFVVWDEVPDLVVRGRMLNRNLDYATARETRRGNMERLYTMLAVIGVIFLAGLAVFAYLGLITGENLRGWTALLAGSLWMIGMGLYQRGKWIEQIP